MATRTFQAAFSANIGEATTVLGFRLESGANRPAELTIDVHMADEIDVDDVVGTLAALRYGYEGDTPSAFSGVVESITGFGAPDNEGSRLFNYRFTVVSVLSLLAWDEDTTIFQDLTTKEIVTKVLETRGIAGAQVDWRLTGTYPKREYCVQYNESVLSFISRLCEYDGIYFFSEFVDGEPEKIVFADDSSSAADIDGEAELPFVERAGMDERLDVISEIVAQRRVVSGKFVLRDFDFKKPTVDLTATQTSDADTDLEVYDYPGDYVDVGEGKRVAKMRLEAEQAERSTLEVVGDCARIQPGRLLKIANAEHADVAGAFFIVAVSHEMVRILDKAEGDTAVGGEQYTTAATLLAKASKYRPPRVTPWPVIEGPQTAKVVAPAGSQIEEIHTDEFGRAKVKFPWDRTSVADDKASAWFRVGQLQTSGSVLLPRIHWEVIVHYLEGNPDRPVVAGRLYNGFTMPPYALPEGKTRTSMQSNSSPGGGGRNEIRFEDKAGGEEISIHSQYDTTIKVANNSTKNIGKNETANVKVDRSVKVGSNQDVKITKASQSKVGGNQSLSVGAMRKVEVNAVTGLKVGGNAKTTVGAMHFEQVGDPLEALISLAAAKAAEFAAKKAGEKFEAIEKAVQGKVDQVMGPINKLTDQAKKLGEGMQGLANGDLGAAAGVLGGAAALPGVDKILGGLGGGGEGGDGGGGEGEGEGGGGGGGDEGGEGKESEGEGEGGGDGGKSAASIALENMVTSYASKAAAKGVRKLAGALGAGKSAEGADGGGASDANNDGVVGDVSGFDATDRAKGPGHSLNTVSGSLTEMVSAMKLSASAEGVMTNVAGAMTQTVGAARADLMLGNRASTVGVDKTETALGLVVLTKGDETEKVKGAKTTMVGGAVFEKITGGHSITAKSPATFIGALHKVEASGSITLKVGDSEVVIDGSGVSIKSKIVTITSPKITQTKAVGEM